MCALGGRLGPEAKSDGAHSAAAVRACRAPPRLVHHHRLPVVSYALPALIAMGHVRHHRAPSRNPITRHLRNVVRRRTLHVLATLQPASGGFLEATPLTSFVVMSLAGMGETSSPVVEPASRFLRESVRAGWQLADRHQPVHVGHDALGPALSVRPAALPVTDEVGDAGLAARAAIGSRTSLHPRRSGGLVVDAAARRRA